MSKRSIKNFTVPIVTSAVGGLLVLIVTIAPKFEIWDRLIQPEPINSPVVLSAKFKYDDSGIYTGEIRRVIEQAGFKYRSINRTFPKEEIVVTSAERIENFRNQAKRILKIHGGDILVYGAVGATINTVWIRFVGHGPEGYMDWGYKVDLGDESWKMEFVRIVEEMATESGIEQILGRRGLESGKFG